MLHVHDRYDDNDARSSYFLRQGKPRFGEPCYACLERMLDSGCYLVCPGSFDNQPISLMKDLSKPEFY